MAFCGVLGEKFLRRVWEIDGARYYIRVRVSITRSSTCMCYSEFWAIEIDFDRAIDLCKRRIAVCRTANKEPPTANSQPRMLICIREPDIF